MEVHLCQWCLSLIANALVSCIGQKLLKKRVMGKSLGNLPAVVVVAQMVCI